MSHSQMIINYVPGDECRVAIVEDGKLEELNSERFSAASRVGNIYVGRVMNVEPSIQAAFIDFGVEENGFLHYSDLHPRYFPGEDVEETTERVGHKTPRRERPPIQQCLRRGQEITVQVLKEGVGTKGPTLTSYLSIPGRFLVMMPQMDKVGVSRKVEDEEQRAKMREILDQLDLPDGFGFILRTAGLDRTKAELKRDLAYLQRLWKDMERRLEIGSGKPRLLCSESDLLVRSLRDQLTADVNEVVIDNEVALQRASRFMKIVAPRSQTKLLHYPGKTPIFHAFGIEQQIATIHAREVSLPGGGRLVIDQTEALVAIDVNSGKMRDSKDAETNAYRTNLEAVDEICRQLRLRDMGGIIVNDLIDMRHAHHRKDVETRFKERLKRDKARTTTAPISLFGILEMTRQRMRGSHESIHFVDCPTCHGRGLVQRPDSVAADALRELAAILDAERVARVELVVAPRVAGELLSSKRQLLGRIERASGKHVDVRVSEAIPVDRVSFYAYDQGNADLDVANLPLARKVKELIEWQPEPSPEGADQWADTDAAPTLEPDIEDNADESAEPHPIEVDEGPLPEENENKGGRAADRAGERAGNRAGDQGGDQAGDQGGDQAGGGTRRRRRRGGRGRSRSGDGPAAGGSGGQQGGPQGGESRGSANGQRPPNQSQQRTPQEQRSDADSGIGHGDGLENSNARDGSSGDQEGGPGSDRDAGLDGLSELGPDGQPRRKRRRRRRGGRSGSVGGGTNAGMGGPGAAGTHELAANGAAPNFADEPSDGPSQSMRTPQAFGQPAEGESAPNDSAFPAQDRRNEPQQDRGARPSGYRNNRRGNTPMNAPMNTPINTSTNAPISASQSGPGKENGAPPASIGLNDSNTNDNSNGGPESDDFDGPSQGGGPRRRRRRGGRGRSSGGGQGGAQGEGQSGGQGGGQGSGPGGGSPNNRASDQGARPAPSSPQPRRDFTPPPPTSPPAPTVPAAPKPKLLYSTRRKLMPSELNKRPKAE